MHSTGIRSTSSVELHQVVVTNDMVGRHAEVTINPSRQHQPSRCTELWYPAEAIAVAALRRILHVHRKPFNTRQFLTSWPVQVARIILIPKSLCNNSPRNRHRSVSSPLCLLRPSAPALQYLGVISGAGGFRRCLAFSCVCAEQVPVAPAVGAALPCLRLGGTRCGVMRVWCPGLN